MDDESFVNVKFAQQDLYYFKGNQTVLAAVLEDPGRTIKLLQVYTLKVIKQEYSSCCSTLEDPGRKISREKEGLLADKTCMNLMEPTT